MPESLKNMPDPFAKSKAMAEAKRKATEEFDASIATTGEPVETGDPIETSSTPVVPPYPPRVPVQAPAPDAAPSVNSRGIILENPYDEDEQRNFKQQENAATIVSMLGKKEKLIIQLLSKQCYRRLVLSNDTLSPGGMKMFARLADEQEAIDLFNRMIMLGGIFYEKGVPVANEKVSQFISSLVKTW